MQQFSIQVFLHQNLT